MKANQSITSDAQLPKAGYIVVLVSKTWNGKRSLKFKSGPYMTKSEGKGALLSLRSRPGAEADYRLLGPKQARDLLKEIHSEQAERRAKGAKKAAKTRKEAGPNNFIRCPKCQAKSKKLCSEFGGLQTRRCANGHVFEYDKWLADRPLAFLIR